jgi:hypothetical protein
MSASFNSGLNTYGLNNSYASTSVTNGGGAAQNVNGGSHSLGYQGGTNGNTSNYGGGGIISEIN